MWWCSSSGRIELNIAKEYVSIGYHQGQCDADIEWLRKEIPEISKQLYQIDPALLRSELQEYGAWDDAELVDHNANLDRILWLACGDLFDSESYSVDEQE